MIAVPNDDHLVQPEDACPRCGQRHVDLLVWIEEGERVRCATCLFVYTPPAPRREGGHSDAPATQ